MSIAAAEARVVAQETLLSTLARAGQETAEAERGLTILHHMLEIERAESRMWAKLVTGLKRKAPPECIRPASP